MSKFQNLFKKLKSIKHIEIILAVLFGLIILLVYFSTMGSVKTARNGSSAIASTKVTSYIAEIEDKLENILSQISGAGEVEVMVMVEDSLEMNSEQIPKIISVVVVSDGASNVNVKLDIIKAIQTLLSLKPSNIEVLQRSG